MGMSKNEGLGFLGNHFEQGFQKNYFPHIRNAGVNFGFGLVSCCRFRRPRVRCFMEPEVGHGTTEVYARVQG
jgi:hypothetical protein